MVCRINKQSTIRRRMNTKNVVLAIGKAGEFCGIKANAAICFTWKVLKATFEIVVYGLAAFGMAFAFGLFIKRD
jgi:hypothetical protein